MRSASDLATEVLFAIDRDRQSFISMHIRALLRACIDEAASQGKADPHAEQARELIDADRKRQDAKWGQQNHDPQVWMAILGEEFGELCQAANDLRWGKPVKKQNVDPWTQALNEAVQTAAVARAVVECLLRSQWEWQRAPSAYDQAKSYTVANDDEKARRYVQLPFLDAVKGRLLVLSETVTDDTLIGSGDECEALVALLSGVCGTGGLKVVEVPHD